jgi:hypothetical protein
LKGVEKEFFPFSSPKANCTPGSGGCQIPNGIKGSEATGYAGLGLD